MKQILISLLFVVPTSDLASCSTGEQSSEEQIEKVIIGYIQHFFLNEYDEMEVFLHDRLSKRGINADGKLSPEYPKEALKDLMNNKPVLPLSMQKNKVTNISIHENVATAQLDTGYPETRWKEYIHLANIDGEWLIMDVFWDFGAKKDN